MNKILKMVTVLICTLALVSNLCVVSQANLVNIENNNYFSQNKIPMGKTGKMMDVTFVFTADKDYENAYAGIAYDDQINNVDENKDNVSDVVAFPFELTSETTELKSIGRIKAGQKRTVTLKARVRRDVAEGYYGVQVYVTSSKETRVTEVQEYINVWISKTTETETSTTKDEKAAIFVLGENQDTPYGVYPNVMNFSINLRNNGIAKAYDVTAALVLDKDDKVFPFDINEANYNHHFDELDVNATVPMGYSFMIRKNVYSGFYPIKMKINYREKKDGELKTFETEFYVNVKNKEVEESTTEAPTLADKDRSKARIIVDSYTTIPEKVLAGQEFELIVNIKNASSDLQASNILFSFEPEKVSDSPVFSSVSGSNSVVVDKLAPGEVKEIRQKLQSKASIDQRSYSLKINEKFDSPQFKNAEESVSIDIYINQIARLTVGTMEVSPEAITVGSEADIAFPISNSGRVTLYNVMVKFSAPFIKENSVYVGNIKPGESGNASALIQGTAVTNSEDKVNITISYEDENGVVATLDKEMELTVTEDTPQEPSMPSDIENDIDNTKKPPLTFIIGGIVLGIILIIVIVTLIKRKKNKDSNEI
jgi:hypothetical protein